METYVKILSISNPLIIHRPGGGGGTQLFFRQRCAARISEVWGLRTFTFEKGGLWTEFSQIWGPVNWKFPNLGACELKISKFGSLWGKFWVKIEAVLRLKFPNFLKRGSVWTDSFAWNGTLANYRRGVKRGSSGLHIPIPPYRSGQCPLPGSDIALERINIELRFFVHVSMGVHH